MGNGFDGSVKWTRDSFGRFDLSLSLSLSVGSHDSMIQSETGITSLVMRFVCVCALMFTLEMAFNVDVLQCKYKV